MEAVLESEGARNDDEATLFLWLIVLKRDALVAPGDGPRLAFLDSRFLAG